MVNFKNLLALIALLFILSGCGQGVADTSDKIDEPVNRSVIETSEEPTETTNDEVELEAQSELETPVSTPAPEKGQIETKSISWYLRPNLEHRTPGAPANAENMLAKHQGFYVLPNNNKEIYLTFDEGYELGYTPQILDTLKANNVKATFFITGHYIKSQPHLVTRMVKEGHMVANHTWNHPNLAKITTEKLNEEIRSLENEFLSLTGTQMGRYMRPPEGAYSEASLIATKELGYKTVFWSIAFNDWDPNNQPGADFSHKYVTDHIHPGAVILLHTVSESNTEALESIIVDLKEDGYKFSLFN